MLEAICRLKYKKTIMTDGIPAIFSIQMPENVRKNQTRQEVDCTT